MLTSPWVSSTDGGGKHGAPNWEFEMPDTKPFLASLRQNILMSCLTGFYLNHTLYQHPISQYNTICLLFCPIELLVIIPYYCWCILTHNHMYTTSSNISHHHFATVRDQDNARSSSASAELRCRCGKTCKKSEAWKGVCPIWMVLACWNNHGVWRYLKDTAPVEKCPLGFELASQAPLDNTKTYRDRKVHWVYNCSQRIWRCTCFGAGFVKSRMWVGP